MATLDDKVQQTSGGHVDRIAALGATGDSTDDLIAHIIQQEQQRAALHEPTQGPSTLERLLPLLATGAGALIGGRTGAHAGLGFGMGLQENQAMAYQQAEEARLGQITALDEALDKQRQRLTTLLQTQPDMFVDPDTMQPIVDPRLIGYAATGMLIPINPATNHLLKRRSVMEDARFDTGKKWFMDGDTPEMRQQGLQMMAAAYGLPLDDEMVALAMQGNESKLWERVMMSDQYDLGSTLAAYVYARQNNVPFADVVSMLNAAPPDTPTLPEATMTALQRYSQILFERPHLNDPTLPLEERLNLAFPDDAKSRMLLEKHFGATGLSLEHVTRLVESNTSTLNTIAAFSPDGLDKVLQRHGLDPKDSTALSQLAVVLSTQQTDAARAMQRQAGARRFTSLSNNLAASLASLGIEGATPYFYDDAALATARALITKFTDPRTHVVDEEAFTTAMNEHIRNPERLRKALTAARNKPTTEEEAPIPPALFDWISPVRPPFREGEHE